MSGEKIRKLTATAMLFALALLLSVVEGLIWQPINGIKLGLSNIVVMFCLLSLGTSSALCVGILKSGFVFLMRGFTAGLLSMSGILLSLCVMVLLYRLSEKNVSYLLLSVGGALAHNIGQLIAVSFLYSTALALYYLPILGLSAVIAGAITATVLKICMPIMTLIYGKNRGC